MALTKISENYVITNHSSSIGEVTQGSTTLTAATLVMTYVGAGTDTRTITLIDSAGTSKTYEFDNDSSVTAGNILVDISDNTSDITFTNLKNAIEGASGHNGTITGVIDTTGGSGFSGILTLTQTVKGQVGNTSATFTGTGYIKDDDPPSAFSGGTGISESLTPVGQFRLGLNNAQTIRGQTTGSYYTTFLGKPKC